MIHVPVCTELRAKQFWCSADGDSFSAAFLAASQGELAMRQVFGNCSPSLAFRDSNLGCSFRVTMRSAYGELAGSGSTGQRQRGLLLLPVAWEWALLCRAQRGRDREVGSIAFLKVLCTNNLFKLRKCLFMWCWEQTA